MRNRISLFVCITIVGTGFLFLTHFNFKAKSDKGKIPTLQNLNLLPIIFEPNRGQAEKDVDFLHSGKNYALSLKNTESVFSFDITAKIDTGNAIPKVKCSKHHQKEFIQCEKAELNFKLLNANPNSKGFAKNPLIGRSNYLFGNNPNKWLKDIPHYGKVKYENVYSGISLEYYGNGSQLEYDFIVTPGANPEQIKFEIEGAEDIHLNTEGDLVIALNENSLIMKSPNIYQNIDGKKESISGWYVVNHEKVSFGIDDYALDRTLIIDPVLVYSTYLGGNASDAGYGIDMDADGNVYIAGGSSSSELVGKQKPAGSGEYNVFVLKLDPSLTSIIYGSFFGGSNSDYVNALDVDNAGQAYVAGQTASDDFPIANAWQDHNKGGWIGDGENHYFDAFITKLNAEGNGFIYSTYLGSQLQDEYGAGNPTYGCDEATGIASDVSGNAYAVGWTNSVHFYTTNNAYQSESGAWAHEHENDAFLTKFDPTGSVVYSTYLGGVNTYETNGVYEKDIGVDDEATGITVDDLGNMYVTGFTDADSFPTTSGAFQTQASPYWYQCFVTKFNPSGTDIVFSTLLVGNYDDISESICIDKDRNIYVTGYTSSDNFPTANPFQPPLVGANGWDAFIAKISADGSNLLYSTYWGAGDTDDVSRAIAVDDSGYIYVTGYTNSPNLVIRNGLPNPYGGNRDAFVLKINPDEASDASLVYSTYLGGSADEFANAIAVDHEYNALVTGSTNSNNFPFTADALQDTIEGAEFSPGVLYSDAFISKIGKHSDFEIIPDGVAYDVLHWDPDVGPLQSSFPTIEITGSDLSEIDNIVFKLPNNEDDPYMMPSNIEASENKVTFDLAVVHSAALGEREIILKAENKPDINVTNKIGRKFIVTRIKSFFNQAVNTSALQTHAHRDILIAEKKGAHRIQLYDDSQLGNIFYGKLTIVGTDVDSTSRKAYPYQQSYTGQELVEGRDYLSIPFPEDLNEGVHEFYSLLVRDSDNLVFSCPLIKLRFVQTEPFDITGVRFTVHSPSGRILQPATDAEIRQAVRFLQRLYPISNNRLSYVEYFTTELFSASTHPNRPLAIEINESVMANGNKVAHLTEAGRNRLVASMYKAHKRVLKEFNNRSNVLVVFLPDSLLYEDGNNDGVINPAQAGSNDFTTAGEAYEARSVILVGTRSHLGGTLSHEIGHLVQSSSYVNALLRGEGNFGDEYEGGLFYCDVNPPVKGLKDWDNKEPCTDSPLIDGVHGNSTGTFASLSAFDPVDMSPKFYYEDITPYFRHFNFMSKAVGDDNTWITVSAYDKLLKIFVPEIDFPGATNVRKSSSNQIIEIPGIIYNDATAVFSDFSLLDSGNPTPPSSGPYSIDLRNSAGATLSSHSFDVEFVKVSEPPVRSDHSLFNVRMERLEGSREAILMKDGLELASQTLSDNPPVVEIAEPQDGARVNGEINLRWAAIDLDNDELSYTIYFSLEPDKMLPTEVALKETSLRLDISELPAHTTGYITVVASDGLNQGTSSITVKILEPLAVEKDRNIQPKGILLHQNYPNPFNAETVIHYELPERANVLVQVINLLGEEVITLIDEEQAAGAHSIGWNGTDRFGRTVASGIYLYKLQAADFVNVKKLVFIK